MTKKKTTGMVSLKEAYTKAIIEKQEVKDIKINKNKSILSPNNNGAKIDSSFELDSFIKMNPSVDTLNKKQKKSTHNELDFNLEGLGIQVARRF